MIMTNEQIYIEVCRMHFIERLSVHEIIAVYDMELVGYQHQTKGRIIKHTNRFEVVMEIILNETEAHLQAQNAR